jgi:uncharacterized protein YjbI with pentapeptide repeats
MKDKDKPKLKPANESPWYCLATLYGEQGIELDQELARKNRIAWNRWVAASLDEDKRAKFVQKGFSAAELTPYDEGETADLRRLFIARLGRDEEPPSPVHGVNFTSVKFDRRVYFFGFLFPLIDFSSATFSDLADFSSATFSDYAFFGSVTFLDYAFFSSAIFWGTIANFDSATFSGTATFRSATFLDVANFGSATFSGTANFGSVTFSDHAFFSSAIFRDDANFINANFKGKTGFAGSIFKTKVPDFRGAVLHEATEWHDAHWPTPPWDKESGRQQVYAYQRLKQEMERLKKHEDELIFFRKELRARRGTFRLLSPNWCLNWLYDVSSGYGQSIARPFLWLLVVFASGMLFFGEVDAVDGVPLSWPDAASLSFANMFSFLSLKRDFFDSRMIAEFSRPVLYVSAMESILAVALLFLLALAVRNRFRIK